MTQRKTPKPRFSPEKYAKLREEAQNPYRGLRRFIYFAFGASGLIGALIFLSKIAAGQNLGESFPNFALQVGLVALMVWLFRIDRK